MIILIINLKSHRPRNDQHPKLVIRDGQESEMKIKLKCNSNYLMIIIIENIV